MTKAPVPLRNLSYRSAIPPCICKAVAGGFSWQLLLTVSLYLLLKTGTLHRGAQHAF